MAEQLVDTSRARLRAFVTDWTTGDDPRLDDAITRVARELDGEAPITVK